MSNKIAQLTYKFPSNFDANQANSVKNMISSKYGAPDYSNGQVGLGKVTYRRFTVDGIIISVYREWRSTTTYIEYIHKYNYKLRQKMLAENKKRKEQKI